MSLGCRQAPPHTTCRTPVTPSLLSRTGRQAEPPPRPSPQTGSLCPGGCPTPTHVLQDPSSLETAMPLAALWPTHSSPPALVQSHPLLMSPSPSKTPPPTQDCHPPGGGGVCAQCPTQAPEALSSWDHPATPQKPAPSGSTRDTLARHSPPSEGRGIPQPLSPASLSPTSRPLLPHSMALHSRPGGPWSVDPW